MKSNKPHVALVTCNTLPNLTASEQELLPLLDQQGLIAEACVWDDPNVAWENYQAWIIRSVWDYYLKPEQFKGWMHGLAQEIGERFWNPYPILQQNSDKQYLQELHKAGLPTVPTLFLDHISQIPTALQKLEGERFILKPSVSASAHHTYQFDRKSGEAGIIPGLSTWPSQKVPMLQPFIKEVAEQGEWSCIFLNGHYSHSVLKTPASGDFRVQEEYGGQTTAQDADPQLIKQAQAYVDFYAPHLLYARVDGVMIRDTFHLMELELIEPELFLHKSPGAHQRFAEAIAQRVLPSPI